MNDRNEVEITELGRWLLEKINHHEDGNQAKLANGLSIHRSNIHKWIRGESKISRSLLLKLKQRWNLSEQDFNKLRSLNGAEIIFEKQINILFPTTSQIAPEVHNLPFPQNPLFTGRKTHMERLDQMLNENGNVPICISGLGGVGKTQLALEYAHSHYPKVYRAVLWVNAADKVTLETSYIYLARLLELPEKDEREADLIVQAVNKWLEKYTRWLLVLDNADNLQLARSILPTIYHGHILLTARSQIVGNIAAQIKVEAMELEEGVLFLLRRSGILKDGVAADSIDADICDAAKQLVEILGEHPLALDQAGAYVEETGTSFATYMQLYSDQRIILLNKRGSLGDEHPQTVVVTFEISFQEARRLHSTVADVLYFCSFLHPDDIPEELFIQNNGLNLNTISFDAAIAALKRYSLINRNTVNKTLSIHRLVQAVLQDTMTSETKKLWVIRSVRVIASILPKVEPTTWSQCERLLAHTLAVATLINQESIVLPETVQLLNWSVYYLKERAQYKEAEVFARQVRRILEQHLGPGYLPTIDNLNTIAELCRLQGKYEEAEPLYQQALGMQEQLEAVHPNMAQLLSNLGLLYWNQGKYAEAESFYLRSLAIYKQVPDTNHLRRTILLNNLAALYEKQGRYTEAEPLYQQVLAIREQELGSDHPEVASILHNFAVLLYAQEKYTEAEPLMRRALSISEQHRGPIHPETLRNIDSLAALADAQRNYAESEALSMHIWPIAQQQLGPEHPETLRYQCNLATSYFAQGRYAEAEPLLRDALTIYERYLGLNHPNVIYALMVLVACYYKQEKYTKTEQLLRQVLKTCEHTLGSEHAQTLAIIKILTGFYGKQGKYTEAEPFLQRAVKIQEQQLGLDHPDIISSLNELAECYGNQKKYEKAEPIFEHVLAICERQFGPEHTDTVHSLRNLALVYQQQDKHVLAEPLYKRVLTIQEQQLGFKHPDTIVSQNNLAASYYAEGKYAEAELLYLQIVAIQEQDQDALTAATLNNLAVLYKIQGKFTEAELLYQQALTINEQQLGPIHPNSVANLYNLLQCYYMQRKVAKVEQLYQHVLATYEHSVGLQDPQTIAMRESFEHLLRIMQQENGAMHIEDQLETHQK